MSAAPARPTCFTVVNTATAASVLVMVDAEGRLFLEGPPHEVQAQTKQLMAMTVAPPGAEKAPLIRRFKQGFETVTGQLARLELTCKGFSSTTMRVALVMEIEPFVTPTIHRCAS